MRPPITFARRLLSVEALASLRDFVFLSPHYQRQGDVWSRSKQRLFIDSVLNGFIIPPMYWHSLGPTSEYFAPGSRYAVVDGRQRLEALFRFLDGTLLLSRDFVLLENPDLVSGPLTLSDIQAEIPWLYAQLMRAEFEVIVIETDEIELIEELFSRLNEGVPLSAAEKRNRGTVLAPAVAKYARESDFFTRKLPFGNTRYRHYDLLAKFMRIEERGIQHSRVPDLRKQDLDRLFERIRDLEGTDIEAARRRSDELLNRVTRTLGDLVAIFTDKDPFLGSVGMVTLYYVAAKYLAGRQLPPLRREEIEAFETLRQGVKNREDEELDERELLVVEFGKYAQGPTSGTYLTVRLQILLRVLRGMVIDDGVVDPASS